MGRPARGVRGIRLDKDDVVIGLLCISKEHMVLSIAENAMGKRTLLDQYRLTARGGKGVINMKTTKRTGDVISIMKVTDENDLMLITKGGKIIRLGADKIRATGRAASGVKLVNLEDGDVLAAAAVVPKSLETEDGDEESIEGEEENGQPPLIQ